MNRWQRMKNRDTASSLRQAIEDRQPCERCGMRPGRHYVVFPQTLEDLIAQEVPRGFWVCPDLYGPDGRRIDA